MTDAPITMRTVADTLRELMDKWEAALMSAAATGYMKDVEGCDRIVELYGEEIEKLLTTPGAFSGDGASALAGWRDLTSAEAEYRRSQMEALRADAPPIDPNAWWAVLDCAPDTASQHVLEAFVRKMQQCSPERVAGAAPEIQQLAKDIEWRLTKAYDQYLLLKR